MPPTICDLSLAVASDLDAELLGDRVRELSCAVAVEEVLIKSETPYERLPGRKMCCYAWCCGIRAGHGRRGRPTGSGMPFM